jgi:hypothetical protein
MAPRWARPSSVIWAMSLTCGDGRGCLSQRNTFIEAAFNDVRATTPTAARATFRLVRSVAARFARCGTGTEVKPFWIQKITASRGVISIRSWNKKSAPGLEGLFVRGLDFYLLNLRLPFNQPGSPELMAETNKQASVFVAEIRPVYGSEQRPATVGMLTEYHGVKHCRGYIAAFG